MTKLSVNVNKVATLRNARAQEAGQLAPPDTTKRGDAKAVISDRTGESITPANLLASAVAGSETTYTLVPAGMARRLGIDRDGDRLTVRFSNADDAKNGPSRRRLRWSIPRES